MASTFTVVYCTLSFPAFHRWKDAPDHVAFLRDYHRHVFHVKAGKEVTGQDREIEFISMKYSMSQYIRSAYEMQHFDYSCEQIAQDLLATFKLKFCEVSEDKENGAIVMTVEDK